MLIDGRPCSDSPRYSMYKLLLDLRDERLSRLPIEQRQSAAEEILSFIVAEMKLIEKMGLELS